MTMDEELGKKRTAIIQGSGPAGTLQSGDDFPVTDADAPELPDQSPKPITIEAMARYIATITSDPLQGNRYPIKDDLSLVKLNSDDGKPVPIVTPSTEAANLFASAELLASLGVVGETFDRDTIERLRDPKLGYHELLKAVMGNSQTSTDAAVATPPETTQLQKSISHVLQRNRFNPEPGRTPYMSNEAASTVDTHPIGRSQPLLGNYDATPVDASTGITYEQMKKVGLALMLRSTGEFIGREADPTGAGVGVAALLPGEAQLGATRVDRKSLWASTLTAEQGRPVGMDDASFGLSSDLALDDGAGSFGNLNSFIEPFGGFAPVGMIALGAALVVALRLVVAGLLETIAIVFSPDPLNDKTLPKPQIYPLGSSRETAAVAGGLISPVDFGIITVKHDYLTCVNRGIDVFFQFDGISFIRVIKSPGYYVVLVREIIRSGAQIVRSIGDAFGGNSNPIAAAQALLGVIDIIRSSKVVGFLNVCAQLGDTVMTLEDQGFLTSGILGQGAGPEDLPDGKVSTIDMLADGPASRVMKSRSHRFATALAWRTSATPSTYLLPSNVFRAGELIGAGHSNVIPAMGLLSDNVSAQKLVGGVNSLITAEDAKVIEDALDSEYVPFYFRDLRTNEIVSFHAFLGGLNETFSANYEKGKFYGRVDPVRIYSDTDRVINLTFNVVATSEEDFDVMWWKVNKLVTMLYPQWSRGTKLKVGDDTFIQPFSQIPTSSPMVRLRLGDVISSNYSKFSLARLFGLGTDDFNLQGSTTKIEEARIEKLKDEITKLVSRQTIDPATAATPDQFGFFTGDKAFLKDFKGILVQASSAATSAIPGAAAVANAAGNLGAQDSPLDNLSSPVKVKVTGRSVDVHPATKVHFASYKVELLEPIRGFSSGPYIVAHSSLQIDPAANDAQARQAAGLDTAQSAELEAVESFFDPAQNVIVRSFESVAGRGLAGFITSMAMDWHKPTWDVRLGHRAPQWCSITMTFEPVHDIAPGLDADGFNRAPVYNVGDAVRGVAGDPYGDDANRREYEKQHASIRGSLVKKLV